MTNEELVALIQAGDRGKLAELWEQVERFVWQQAYRRHRLSDGFGGAEVEDLYQSGYLALVSAADTYDPAAGMSFIGWFALSLKTAFSETAGCRSRKQARDPLHRAGSLDAPAIEDSDSTVAELVVDPRATQDIYDAEDRVYQEQLHAALEKALDELPYNQAEALRRRFYQKQGPREIAAAEGVQWWTVQLWQKQGLVALRRLRIMKELRLFLWGADVVMRHLYRLDDMLAR